jgi:hypothetical protein
VAQQQKVALRLGRGGSAWENKRNVSQCAQSLPLLPNEQTRVNGRGGDMLGPHWLTFTNLPVRLVTFRSAWLVVVMPLWLDNRRSPCVWGVADPPGKTNAPLVKGVLVPTPIS